MSHVTYLWPELHLKKKNHFFPLRSGKPESSSTCGKHPKGMIKNLFNNSNYKHELILYFL